MSGSPRPPGPTPSPERPPTPRSDEELGSGAEERQPGLPAWAWRLVGGLVVLLMVALVALPILLSSEPDPEPPAAEPPRLSVAPRVPRTLPPDLRWEPRGDLADETFVVLDARQRLEGHEVSRVTNVIWADRVPGGRAVLVTGEPQLDEHDGVVTVPVWGVLRQLRGVDNRSRVHRVGSLSRGEQLVGWLLDTTEGPMAVVVGPPGPLTVRLSSGVDYAADGSARRRFVTHTGPDGVVVRPMALPAYPAPAFFDAAGRGHPLGPVPAEPSANLAVRGIADPAYAGPEPVIVRETVAAATREPPLVGGPVDIRVAWSGRLAERIAAVVLVYRRADGAAFQQTLVVGPVERTETSVRPVPWQAADTYPAVIDVPSGRGQPLSTAVLNPAGPGSVTFRDASGTTVTLRSDSRGATQFAARVFDATTTGSLVLEDRLGRRTVPVGTPTERDPLALNPADAPPG